MGAPPSLDERRQVHYKTTMLLKLDAPTPLEYFSCLVQSDDQFPLLEAAVSRFGGGPDQAPALDALVALDLEVRAAYATGAVA